MNRRGGEGWVISLRGVSTVPAYPRGGHTPTHQAGRRLTGKKYYSTWHGVSGARPQRTELPSARAGIWGSPVSTSIQLSDEARKRRHPAREGGPWRLYGYTRESNRRNQASASRLTSQESSARTVVR